MSSQFKKLPMFLFSDYRELSSDAKILYALLSDRKTLSEKNGKRDESGVFVYFTLKDVDRFIPSSKGKASRLMKELRDSGLISRKRMGQGKADRIYVLEPAEEAASVNTEDAASVIEPNSSPDETQGFTDPAPSYTENYHTVYLSVSDPCDNIQDRMEENCPVTGSPDETQEFTDPAPSYTENYHTVYLSVSDPCNNMQDRTDGICLETASCDPVGMIADNTGLSDLPDDPVNRFLLDVISEVMEGKGTLRINGTEKPKSVIRSVFLKLDRDCIGHFFDRLVNLGDLKAVRNKRAYFRSMLYNSYFEQGFVCTAAEPVGA